MNDLNSLLLQIIEIGNIKIDFKIEPDFLKSRSDDQIKIVPNSSIQVTIPNLDTKKNSSYTIPSDSLDNFVNLLNYQIADPNHANMSIPDEHQNQLIFTPQKITSVNNLFQQGYNIALLNQPHASSDITLGDLQRLITCLSNINITNTESNLINQFTILNYHPQNNLN